MSQGPIKKKDTLQYHQMPKPGKIEVIPTKPSNSQRDLSIAYSPGVADPCLEIAAKPEEVYKYTAKGNLVARCHFKASAHPFQGGVRASI